MIGNFCRLVLLSADRRVWVGEEGDWLAAPLDRECVLTVRIAAEGWKSPADMVVGYLHGIGRFPPPTWLY